VRHGELALARTCRGSCLGRVQLRGLNPHQRAHREDDIFTSVHIEGSWSSDTSSQKSHARHPERRKKRSRISTSRASIRIGAEVKPATCSSARSPEGQTQLSPKRSSASDLRLEGGRRRDSSLRVPPALRHGHHARVFSRKGTERTTAPRNRRLRAREARKGHGGRDQIIRESAYARVRKLLAQKITRRSSSTPRGRCCSRRAPRSRRRISIRSRASTEEIEIEKGARRSCPSSGSSRSRQPRSRRSSRRRSASSARRRAAAGVIKMVKVYVAIKRKLQVGDKMAGRHGNRAS